MNDGQRVTAKVGQPIVVTLQTIGGGRYDTPQISSRAVRFEGSAFAPPREQNPGGPKQVYRFTQLPREERKSESRTRIQIPLSRLRFRSQNPDRLETSIIVSDYHVNQKFG